MPMSTLPPSWSHAGCPLRCRHVTLHAAVHLALHIVVMIVHLAIAIVVTLIVVAALHGHICETLDPRKTLDP